MTLLPWNRLKRKFRAKMKCCGYFWNSLDGQYGASPEALGPADIIVESRKKIASRLCNH